MSLVVTLPRAARRKAGPATGVAAPFEVEDALGVVLKEIDEIAKATFRSITLDTMLKLVERRRAVRGI